MFEFDQDAVDALLLDSKEFRRLYDRYATLKTRIRLCNDGRDVMEQPDLEGLKKAKLLLKDQMAARIKDYRQAHA